MQKEHAILLTLLDTKGLSAKVLRTLKVFFSSWETLLCASAKTLTTAGARGSHIAALKDAQRTYAQTDMETILAPYAKHDVQIISFDDNTYPPLLREAPDAPLMLFVRGAVNTLSTGSFVTIVGSREHTAYGERAAYSLAHDLACAGVTVISGLARGIDAIAHRGALDADGVTLGVLGGSIDDAHIAPRQNHRLAHAMLQRGAILSEYPLYTMPAPYTFPARNRIMAAMAHLTLVIEAADRSGTLITARNALEYNRDICAVPGPIFSDVSVGTNKLIRDGAKIVSSVQDILVELPQPLQRAQQDLFDTQTVSTPASDLSQDETRIFSLLSQEALHIDKITTMSKLETTHVLSALSLLEIKGHIRDIGSKCYIRTSEK